MASLPKLATLKAKVALLATLRFAPVQEEVSPP